MADFFDAFRDIETPEPLYPCSNCGRKFISDTLVRHEKICSTLKKRKPFNSSKQRTEGIPESERLKILHPSPSPTKSKKNNWRQKHEDFLNTVRSARGVTSAIKKGGPLPPPPPQRIDPDLVQCPHCSRRFNKHSAERHIQFCKEQKSRIGKSPGSASSVAAQRVAARTKYKPPPLVKRPPSGTTLSSTAKTRQTKTRLESPTQPDSSQVLRHEDRPLPVRNQGNRTKMDQSATRHADSKQTVLGRQKSAKINSEESSRTQSNLNGQQSAYHSNRYKTIDNHIESNFEREGTKPKEIRYGRRASKTQECDGVTQDIDEETQAYSRVSGLQNKGHRSVKRGHITVHGASPTFDDQPSSVNRKNPFPSQPFSKTQSHRPYAGDHQLDDTEEQRRLSKFCHECGTKYPVSSAKFCCECGTKRLHIH